MTDQARAQRLAEGIADGISFGRPFISNPDLVHRLARWRAAQPGRHRAPSIRGGAAGYVDYPTLDEAQGRLGAVLFAKLEQRKRGARGMSALVALPRVGASDRLCSHSRP